MDSTTLAVLAVVGFFVLSRRSATAEIPTPPTVPEANPTRGSNAVVETVGAVAGAVAAIAGLFSSDKP